jgi:hypothetical protein
VFGNRSRADVRVFGCGLLLVGRLSSYREIATEAREFICTVDGEDIRSSGLVQVSDGLYTEVLLWCASGPIARRWIVSTCVWRLSDCKNVSSC